MLKRLDHFSKFFDPLWCPHCDVCVYSKRLPFDILSLKNCKWGVYSSGGVHSRIHGNFLYFVFIPSTPPCIELICWNCSWLTNSDFRTLQCHILCDETPKFDLTSEMQCCSWFSRLSLYINSTDFSRQMVWNKSLQISLSGKCKLSLTISITEVLIKKRVFSAMLFCILMFRTKILQCVASHSCHLESVIKICMIVWKSGSVLSDRGICRWVAQESILAKILPRRFCDNPNRFLKKL